MSVTSMGALLRRAVSGGYAIGYFESWDQYAMEAVMEAAEKAESAAILGFGAAVSNQEWLMRCGVKDLTTLARRMAERSSVPTAVLFNEVRTLDQVVVGLDCGCNAVMLDTSHLPYGENIDTTCRVVEAARRYGADVEAELGHLPTAIDPEAHAALTDPTQAAEFVATTGVDALAVSIGNTHLVLEGAVGVDLEHLAALRRAVSVPLVLHGGSGLSEETVRSAVSHGVAKFNIGTRIKRIFMEGVRAGLPAPEGVTDIHPYVGSHDATDFMICGKNALSAEIGRLIRLYGSAGSAWGWP
jgi:ketose-bisphosphate aldolase